MDSSIDLTLSNEVADTLTLIAEGRGGGIARLVGYALERHLRDLGLGSLNNGSSAHRTSRNQSDLIARSSTALM